MKQYYPLSDLYWDALESAGLTVHGFVSLLNHSSVWDWCVCGTFQGQLLFGYGVYGSKVEEDFTDPDWDVSWTTPNTPEGMIEFGRHTIQHMVSYEQLHSKIEQSKLGVFDRTQLAEWLKQLTVVQAYLAHRAAAATLAALAVKPLSSP